MPSKETHGKITFLVVIMCLVFISETSSGEEDLLPRRKRYVVFPEGSSFSIALCMTVHTLTSDNTFTEGLNWGISYDLPNESKPELEPFLQLRRDKLKSNKYSEDSKYSYAMNNKHNDHSKPDYSVWNNEGKYYQLPGGKKYYSKADYHYLQRRYRRNLYNKLEVVINAMGFDGRSCILRALCEASQRFLPRGNTLVEEMVRIVFALPMSRVFSFEPEEHQVYTGAHKAGREGGNCRAMFPGCSFSLIDMALGKYSAPDEEDETGDSVGASPPPPYPLHPPSDVAAGTFDIATPDLRLAMK